MHKVHESKKELLSKYYFIVVLFLPLATLLFFLDHEFLALIVLIPFIRVSLVLLQRLIFPALVVDENYIKYYKYGFLFRSKKKRLDDIEYIVITQPFKRLRAESQDNIVKLCINLKNNKREKIRFNPRNETQENIKKIIKKYANFNVKIELIDFDKFIRMKQRFKQ